jgi:hypothetical protein
MSNVRWPRNIDGMYAIFCFLATWSSSSIHIYTSIYPFWGETKQAEIYTSLLVIPVLNFFLHLPCVWYGLWTCGGDACEVSSRRRWFPSPDQPGMARGTQCVWTTSIWSSKMHTTIHTRHVLDLLLGLLHCIAAMHSCRLPIYKKTPDSCTRARPLIFA